MKIEYDSNNSGGRWWLTDEHWQKLEAAGWDVEWYRNDNERLFKLDEDGRWLRALASKATKDFNNFSDAIREWEKITGLDASEEGCNCCGPPHTFRTEEPEYIYVSGSECLQYLFDKVPSTLREAAEALNKSSAENGG